MSRRTVKKEKEKKVKVPKNIMENVNDALTVKVAGKDVVVFSQTYKYKIFWFETLKPNIAVAANGNIKGKRFNKKENGKGGYVLVRPFCLYRYVNIAEITVDPKPYEIRAKDKLMVFLDLAYTFKITDPEKAAFEHTDVFEKIRTDLQSELVRFAFNRTNEEIVAFNFKDLTNTKKDNNGNIIYDDAGNAVYNDEELSKLNARKAELISEISAIKSSDEYKNAKKQKAVISSKVEKLSAYKNKDGLTPEKIAEIDGYIENFKAEIAELDEFINHDINHKEQEIQDVTNKAEDIHNLRQSFKGIEAKYGVKIVELLKQNAKLDPAVQAEYDKLIVNDRRAKAEIVAAEGDARAEKLRAEGRASALLIEGKAKAEAAGMMYDMLAGKNASPEDIAKMMIMFGNNKMEGLAFMDAGNASGIAKTLKRAIVKSTDSE